MADENVDRDYHGSPYISLSLRERSSAPSPQRKSSERYQSCAGFVLAELPDGSRAILARDGWYAFDEERLRADYDRPVEVPEDLSL